MKHSWLLRLHRNNRRRRKRRREREPAKIKVRYASSVQESRVCDGEEGGVASVLCGVGPSEGGVALRNTSILA